MNRPFDDEQFDPRLNRLSTGEVPADAQSRAHAALAGLRDKMDRVETQKESLIMKIFANRWARLGWAGSFAAVLFVCYIVFGPNKSGVAFAEVAARLRTFKTMVYTGTVEVNPKGTDSFAQQMRKMAQTTTTVRCKSPGLVRTDMMGGMGYFILDIKNKKSVSVVPLTKTFIEMDMSSMPQSQMKQSDLIERMMTMPDRADKILEPREIDGRMLCGFVVHESGMEMTVWADPKTGGPARVEMTLPDSPGSKIIIKDFKFDVPLDDSLFDMQPPDGYKRLQMKIETPTEQDVLGFFKEWTEADPNHAFPDTFTMFTAMKMPKQMQEKFEKNFRESMPDPVRDDKQSTTSKTKSAIKAVQDALNPDPQVQQKQIEGTLKLMMPFQFMTYLEERGGEWHYAGKGVKFGEARPVCWWREKDSKTWRVIYGDLKISDMPREDLSKFLDSIKRIDTATSATK
ncbi:MAG: hypothetical protein ABFD69_03030 [Candidatus Sumerlaeia bacterium]